MNRGTLAPLFDRIIDDRMETSRGSQLLTANELKASIVHEISVILNTRCTVRRIIYEDHIETIPLFGLPDFFGLEDWSDLGAGSTQDWAKAARFLETAIQAAEPRLTNIRVTVEAYDPLTQTLSTRVYGSVKENHEIKEFNFPLTLSHKSSDVSKKKSAA